MLRLIYGPLVFLRGKSSSFVITVGAGFPSWGEMPVGLAEGAEVLTSTGTSLLFGLGPTRVSGNSLYIGGIVSGKPIEGSKVTALFSDIFRA